MPHPTNIPLGGEPKKVVPVAQCFNWNGFAWAGKASKKPVYTPCGLENCIPCGAQCYVWGMKSWAGAEPSDSINPNTACGADKCTPCLKMEWPPKNVTAKAKKSTGKCYTWNKLQWKGSAPKKPVSTECGRKKCTPCATGAAQTEAIAKQVISSNSV